MRHAVLASGALLLAVALTACSPTSGPAAPASVTVAPSATASPAPPTMSEPPPGAQPSPSVAAGWQLLVLGDSGSTGHGDPYRYGWPTYYARQLSEARGVPVTLVNEARDGTSTAALLDALTSDGSLADEVAAADIVAIGMGGAELNAADAGLEGGSCAWKACYTAAAATFGTNLAAIGNEIRRRNPDVVLRIVGVNNSLTGAESVIPPFLSDIATDVGAHMALEMSKAACDAAAAAGGACADIVEAFNGADGRGDAYASGLMNLADCCYASQAGHRRIAEILVATGVDGLTP